MGNVGTGILGSPLQGSGVGKSPTFFPIGTNSGITGNLLGTGNGAFTNVITHNFMLQVGFTGNTTINLNLPLTTNALLFGSSSTFPSWHDTTANGVFITNVSGVPSWSVGTTGQVLTATTGSFPTWQSPATSGTVTSVSGTANQVAVASGTTTPVISLIGPFTPATFTAHGLLVGEGTSSIVAMATGSAGQVVQSGGASADPVYSTATYPATATGTGKILIADGTNWVASTPTFPATAGTSGNVLTSDGTNFVSSAAPGGGIIYTSSVTLTSAQIKALHGTPIQIVAAPGAGNVIVPINAFCKFTYGGTNVFVAGLSQYIALTYGTTINLIFIDTAAAGTIRNVILVSTASSYQTSAPAGGGNGSSGAIASFENKAVNAYNPVATEITGNAANDNTVHIGFMYYIATL